MTASSTASPRPRAALVDPRELTASELKALELVASYRMRRVKSGWQAPGSPRINLSTVQALGHRHLVERRVDRLEPTVEGRLTLTIAYERRRK